jgi:hypothetical protein
VRRVERWATRWCDWYTSGLLPDAASDRRAELASDLHDQAADEASQADVASRWLRGVPADLSWRRGQLGEARAAGMAAPRGILLPAAYSLAVLMLAWGVVATLRVLVDHGVRIGATTPPMVALGAALAALGLVLFGRVKTRLLGAALLSVAAFVSVTAAADASTAISWTVGQYFARAVSAVATHLSIPVALGALYLPAIVATAIFVTAAVRGARRRAGRSAEGAEARP